MTLFIKFAKIKTELKYEQELRGGACSLGFTITELITAMVVLALVVMATTPIIRKKMEKVSYAQYWMGYNTALDIAKDVQFFDDSCDVKFGGYCWTISSRPTPMSYSECTGGVGTPGDDLPAGEETKKLGINSCRHDNDYWAATVKKCGGTTNMPTRQQLADLASEIYGQEIGVKDWLTGLTIVDQDLFNTFETRSPYSKLFYIWAGDQHSYDYAYRCAFGSTTLKSVSGVVRNGDTISLTVCKGDAASEPVNLCEKIKDKLNTSDYDCTLENANDSSDFTNPHITFSNGLKLFMGSDFEELFPDAESENDRFGYKVYIDINGSKGKGILWKDVFPFYVLKSGKVLAGYPSDAKIGGNSNEYLSVNILYDDYSGTARTVKFLQTSADYKTAVCKTGIIKSKSYCGDVTEDNICKTYENDCRIKVKSPIKIF